MAFIIPPEAKSPSIVGEGSRIGKPGADAVHALHAPKQLQDLPGELSDAWDEAGTVGWARTTDLLFHRQAL
jgi:hypothetical protein